MKITFLSVCSSYNTYKEYIETIGKSFEKTNDFAVDWNIYTDDVHQDIICFKNINIILHKIDTSDLYNMFIIRLYKILELKSQYDVICLVDLDILFLGNVYDDLVNVFNSDCEIGCQKMNVNHSKRYFPEVNAYSDSYLNEIKDLNYCNTGFAIINAHNIDYTIEEVNNFVEKYKNDIYCYDEAFFTFRKQYIIDNLQDNKDVIVNRNMQHKQFKVCHFSFGRYLLKYDIVMNRYIRMIYKKYIKYYYEITTDNIKSIIRGYL